MLRHATRDETSAWCSVRSFAGCAVSVVAMACAPGPSSPGTDRVPAATLPRPVVLGSVELCGQAQPVLDLLHGTEHPTWNRAPADRGGHVVRWHAFTPRHFEDQGRPAAFDFTEVVCGRTTPDVLTLEAVDGTLAEVTAAWVIPAATPADGLSCKQALENALGVANGVPATHRDEWNTRGMVIWVWSETALKTEVVVDTYQETDDRTLLEDIPRPAPAPDGPVLGSSIADGGVRVVMRFRCTPLVQQVARDALREENRRD